MCPTTVLNREGVSDVWLTEIVTRKFPVGDIYDKEGSEGGVL